MTSLRPGQQIGKAGLLRLPADEDAPAGPPTGEKVTRQSRSSPRVFPPRHAATWYFSETPNRRFIPLVLAMAGGARCHS